MFNLVKILVGPISKILDKVIPDKDARERMAHEIATMAETQTFELAKAQMDVNKQEAAHKSLFVAGWRPGAGWVCVTGMAMNYLIMPIGNFVLAITNPDVVIPALDLSQMMPVLLGMLGLGSLRSYEKRNGVSRET